MIELTKIIELFGGIRPWVYLVFALLVWILPLHFAVKFVGGDTNILKTFAYSILSAFLHLFSVLLLSIFNIGEYGIFIAFFITAWFYSRKFNVGIIRGSLILVLQYVFGIMVSFIINFLNIISVKEALIKIGVKL